MDKKNITLLETKAVKDKASLMGAVRLFKSNLPEMLQLQALIAEIQRERYLQLVKSGFSEEQALQLAEKASLSI